MMINRITLLLSIFLIIATCKEDTLSNHPPKIQSITFEPTNPVMEERVHLIVDAIDKDDDSLEYKWSSTEGSWQDSIVDQEEVIWIAPFKAGNCTISLIITDIEDTIDTSLTILVSKKYCFKDDFDNSSYSAARWICGPVSEVYCSFDQSIICAYTPRRNWCAMVTAIFESAKTVAFNNFFSISCKAVSDSPYDGQQNAVHYIFVGFPSGFEYEIDEFDDDGDPFIISGIGVDVLADGSTWLLFENINPEYSVGVDDYFIGQRPFDAPSSYDDNKGAWNAYMLRVINDVIEFYINHERIFFTPQGKWGLKNIPLGVASFGACGYPNISWCFDDVEICSEEEEGMSKHKAAPSTDIPDEYWNTFTPAEWHPQIR